tara:strand:+ start:221 stop:745 length:525 start_codon:yes stop_codon:yes gene_type:complete
MLKQINKIIQRSIKQDVFFHEITLEIDDKYFISEIERKITKSLLHYKTSVMGKMTTWDAFNNDKNFLKVLNYGLQSLKDHISYEAVFLKSAWGIKIEKNGYSKKHNHHGSVYSGILYLNDVDQEIFFPDLSLAIKPKKGTFITFSSCLQHYTNPHQNDEIKYAIPFNLNYHGDV